MERLYFPHECGAWRSPKLTALRAGMGMSALAVYWCLIEYLYEHGNRLTPLDLKGLSYDMRTRMDRLQRILNEFELFECDEDGNYYSVGVQERLERIKEKGETYRQNALKRKQIIDSETSTNEGVTNSQSTKKQPVQPSPSNGSAMAQPLHVNNKIEKENNIINPLPPKGGGSTTQRKFVISPDNPPAWVSPDTLETFSEWLSYKRAKGKGYANERTAKICYEELMKMANSDPSTAKEIVRRSIAANWDGLFPLQKAGGRAQPFVNNMVINTQKTEYKPWS